MNRILVQIYLPTLRKFFDVFVPVDSYIYEIRKIIMKALSQLSDGTFICSPDTELCDYESGEIYDINMTVTVAGIVNGSRLMLI